MSKDTSIEVQVLTSIDTSFMHINNSGVGGGGVISWPGNCPVGIMSGER